MSSTGLGLKGRVALVTGAAYGLGRAIAEYLARQGASVMLSDIDPRLEATSQQLMSAGLTVGACRIDVRDRHSFAMGIKDTLTKFGRIDILVNNAGYSRTTIPLLQMDLDEWETSMQINTRSVLFAVQEVVPAMQQTAEGKGRIINIASTAAYRPYKQKGAYCVSKSAMVALTRVAALELAEFGITVNGVAPGQTDTETTRLLQSDPAFGEGMRRRAAMIPLGMGLPSHIAQAVGFFASSAADHVTGQILLVDGGTLLV